MCKHNLLIHKRILSSNQLNLSHRQSYQIKRWFKFDFSIFLTKILQLWFLEQLTRDVRFLQRLRRIDYSLLIGIQPFRNDDLDMPEAKGQRPATGQSLQSLVSSVKRYGKSQKPCKDHQSRDHPMKIPSKMKNEK